MRIQKLLTVFFSVALAATMAQGPRGGAGRGQGNENGPGNRSGQVQLDLGQIQTVTGKVTAVNIGTGIQLPSMEVAGQTIRIGPSWFLLEQDFEIQVGDEVVVDVAPPLNSADGYVYALRIQNVTRQKTIQFRSESGQPEWARRGGQAGAGNGNRYGAGDGTGYGAGPDNGNGKGDGTGNPDACAGCGFTSIQTATGTVSAVSAGVGIGQPNLVLTVEGVSMTIKLGPFRILQQLGLVFEIGSTVTVQIGVSACTGENVAIAVETSDGTIQLRNPDGSPAWLLP